MKTSPHGWIPLLALLGVAVTVCAQAPSWWTNRNMIATNLAPRDFAPINQGQLKWMATQAAAEFDEKLALVGGADLGITGLLSTFSPTNNYRPVNLGQLKYVSAPFYDRLWELGLTNCYSDGAGMPYPWSNATNAPRDFALANIGQAKYVFSFDPVSLSSNLVVDSDDDGLPDDWEVAHGLNPNDASDARSVSLHAWAHGLLNIETYNNPSVLLADNFSSPSDGVQGRRILILPLGPAGH